LFSGSFLAVGHYLAALTQGHHVMPRKITTLTLADARAMITAGEKKAQEIGVPYNLAVVDAESSPIRIIL
jgi:hypothetical protein